MEPPRRGACTTIVRRIACLFLAVLVAGCTADRSTDPSPRTPTPAPAPPAPGGDVDAEPGTDAPGERRPRPDRRLGRRRLLPQPPERLDPRSHAFEGPQFDADAIGKLVVYRDSSLGVNVDDEIWVLDARTGRARNLTEMPDSNEWGPAWSPDGTRIAFSSDVEGGCRSST